MGIGFGALEGLVGLIALAGLVLLVMALVDLVKRPADVWKASGHSQIVWALVVIFIGFIGPLLYMVMARPALDAAASRIGSTGVAHS
ncbi:MAG: hypothetical protein HKN74_00195 [Acidimicrobiia bacterium]|nr:PLDc N-terminal domain-containing protein [Acidimicrobiia bacterium]NNF08690.1 hypothetical protein [Acidimicrobiia bacterium]NNL70218.1 hypothetical protein [Acidimicrobiia bacterium]